SGTMTYFNTGLGSCGWTTADSDFIVAMNVQQYSLSVCGRTVCITNGGKTVQARVVDLCPSCVYGKLDASPAVFSSFADLGKGVIDISWDY
ncbi:RlpA-like double-psi beta-barrel-protein domain-containing protein-containing protein, partial [Cladochytrium replicatum]